MRVYTIGHSTRTLDEFLGLLGRDGVRHVADVRAFPASRRHPHFNGPALAAALGAHGIRYSHLQALGGRRRGQADSPNGGWRSASFRAYADHMASAEFRQGLDALIARPGDAPVAIMCAEAVPWRCHRTLIADALMARGVEVLHILDSKSAPHVLTPFAVLRAGEVRYPSRHAEPPQRALFDQ